jgi:hypothetical protein
MNRRSFFATVLAPVVVPWNPRIWKLSNGSSLRFIPGPVPGKPFISWTSLELDFSRMVHPTQEALDRHYNQLIDNITLSNR